MIRHHLEPATLGTVTCLALLTLASPPRAAAQTLHGPCGIDNRRDFCIHQDSVAGSGVAVADSADPGDLFGRAVAFGDFDDDGFADLAVGAPGDSGVGRVHVFYGTPLGIGLAGQQNLSQNALNGADEGAEAGDDFGFALATGDFDADGFDDLAIGSPGEDLPEPEFGVCGLDDICQDTGGVHVVYGSASGLDSSSSEFLHDATFPGGSGGEDAFIGTAMAALDIDGDSFADLAVGSPSTSTQGEYVAIFGSVAGLNNGGSPPDRISQDNSSCDEGTGQPTGFGQTLAPGAFQVDAGAELLIGAPGCTVAGTSDTGAVFFQPSPTQFLDERYAQSDFPSAGNGADDAFGFGLAAGNWNGDAFDDFAAGAPFKNHGSGNPSNSGRVYAALNTLSGFDLANGDIIGEDEWSGQTPAEDERFGTRLAGGDLDGDGFDDLLIGAPREGASDVGNVFVKRGSAAGLTTTGNFLFAQTQIGGAANNANDHFGTVLAAADLDGDGKLEVAIGVPEKDVNGQADAGMVYITRAFDPDWIFADSFESNGLLIWSSTAP